MPSVSAETPPDPVTPPVPPEPAPVPSAAVDSSASADSAAPVSADPGVVTPVPEQFEDYEELTPELVEDEAIRGDFVLRWAVVLIAVLLASTSFTETIPLTHIASGRYLATHGIIPPALDPLGAATADRRWDNLSWGFDLLSAGVHALGGFTLFTLMKAVFAGVIFAILVHIARPEIRTWWHAICAALVLVACRNHFGPQPYLFTLLGVVGVLGWVLWPRLTSRPAPALLPLLVMLGVWSNFDGRMWFGPLLLTVSWLASLVDGSPASPEEPSRRTSREMGRAALGGWLVAALHPFGWRVWLAPFQLYARDYPAFREYLAGGTPSGSTLTYFPISEPAFWKEFEISSIAVGGIVLAAFITLFLNRRRLLVLDVLLLMTAVALGGLAIKELAVLAVVSGVIAALNGQAWYAATFPQTYSTETRELLFSRGGRAITVCGLAALAFFGATGRLPGPASPMVGLGLDRQQQITLDATGEVVQHLPSATTFNIRPPQGDQLLFHGIKPFIDSRLPLYAGHGRENLIALHRKVRTALLRKSPDDPSTGDVTLWKTVLDKYGITSVVPRLSGGAAQAPDHTHLVELIGQADLWQLQWLGAAAAVFVRTDVQTPELVAWLREHPFDLEKTIYKTAQTATPPRDRFSAPPSFYDRYVWRPKRVVPAESLAAVHYYRLHSEPALPRLWQRQRHALAIAGLRAAQAGVTANPDSPEAWTALGTGYRLMMNWENTIAPSNIGPPPANARYYQAVAAFRQALVGDPDSDVARNNLLQLYQFAQRPDLALGEITAIMESLQRRRGTLGIPREALREMLAEMTALRTRLKQAVEGAEKDFNKFAESNQDPIDRCQIAARLGLYAKALELLEASREKWVTNLSVRSLYAGLLLEAGRVEDALTELQQLQLPADQAGFTSYREPLAIGLLMQADYDRALAMLHEGIDSFRKQTIGGLMQSLTPRGSGSGVAWPIEGLSVSFATLGPGANLDDDSRLWAGAIELEAGRPAEAITDLRPVAYGFGNPEIRGLAGFYLQLLTGENAELIPVLFEPES